MAPLNLAANFSSPSLVTKPDEIRVYWTGNQKLYPRTRYRLTYDISKRTFTLEKFLKLRSDGSKEMKRTIGDQSVISVFRSALLPEQIAEITRASMSAPTPT